ncbi:MAG: DUF3300 domain-containing protein [Candidatus Competibacteraceae bacterium]
MDKNWRHCGLRPGRRRDGSYPNVSVAGLPTGNLKDNEQQVVTQEQVEVDGGAPREVIIIRSANPEVIYVPRYDPTVVVVSGYAGPSPIYYSTPYPYYYSPAATFFTRDVCRCGYRLWL